MHLSMIPSIPYHHTAGANPDRLLRLLEGKKSKYSIRTVNFIQIKIITNYFNRAVKCLKEATNYKVYRWIRP